ncbi:MAG: type I-E CRISPR-associated protein Cse2/CasB [Anaeromyxobacteraceae bacterium]
MSEAEAKPPSKEVGIASIVGRIAQYVNKGLSPGDVAQLRRITWADANCRAFWRLAAEVLVPDGAIPEGAGRDDAERRWAVILNAIALANGLYAPRRRMGAALADAGFSELRFVRLLRASGPAVGSAAATAVRYLAAKGEPFDFAELALLVLSDGRADEADVRKRLARSYYAAENAKA